MKRSYSQHKCCNTTHIYFIVYLILFVISNDSLAATITITGKTIVSKPTIYKNVNLDLTHGYFLVTNNASLQIENSELNGTVSPENPYLINLLNGNLIVKDSVFNVSSNNIAPSPTRSTIYKVINITQGNVDITDNQFTIDKPYTTSLLVTGRTITSDFIISNNKIQNFHGGIFLSNSNNAIVLNNQFSNVSITNIFTKNGNNNLFKGNIILFSGNNSVGNAIDIIDSDNILLSDNYISLGSCYCVVILRSQNIIIDNNKIIGGITYAIYITPSIGLRGSYDNHLAEFTSPNLNQKKGYANKNITITNNYLSQNRYGLTAINVESLIVKNNIFIQQFPDSVSRSFWTDNDNLLQDINNLSWEDNVYKEAFAQNITDSNSIATKFVPFPEHGGVAL